LNVRSILAGMVVLVLGFTVLWLGTDGFRAFTAEGARRLAVYEKSVPLPLVSLQDSAGALFSLQDYHGKLVLVTFIYTRCPTLCYVLGDSLQRIHNHLLPQKVLGQEVVLLRII